MTIAATPAGVFDELYRTEVDSIFAYLLYRCGNRSTAEELTAEVFVQAFNALNKAPPGDVGPAWLRTVASRRLIDRWRSQGAERRRTELVGLRDEIAAATHDNAGDRVERLLDQLPETFRQVLVLRYLEDLPVNEVAEITARSYKATESLLARARAAFRAADDEQDVI